MSVHKFISFFVTILLVTVLFAGVVTLQAAAQYDAMQFRYNAQHSGDYGPVAGNAQPNEKLRWSFTTGGHTESPAVANGIVYVASENYTTFLNTTYGVEIFLNAINATNGAEIWRVTIGNTTTGWSPSTPAVVNGVVYIGSSDGSVYALNAATGDKLWNYATAGPVYSSPAVVNGVVYVGSNDTKIYALDANTGAQLWSYKASGSIHSSPTVDNGVVYINSDGSLISSRTYSEGPLVTVFEQVYRGEVYALWADTGKKYWNYTLGDTIGGGGGSSPAVVNGIIYVGSGDHNIYAFNAGGNKLWNYTTGGGIISSPAVVNGVVYVGSGDWNYYAINSSTGAKLWSYVIGNLTNGCTSGSSPAVASGVVYITAGNGDLYALDGGTGTLKWMYGTGYNRNSCPSMEPSPAIADGIVYVGSYDGNIYAIGNTTGGQSGSFIPGFEIAFAVIGLAIAAYVVSRRR